MVERILQILKVKNLTPSKFADQIGIQRSGMSHIMSGRNYPSLDLVMKIINQFPDINPEWLLMGVGHMIKSTQMGLFDQQEAATANNPNVQNVNPAIERNAESGELEKENNKSSGMNETVNKQQTIQVESTPSLQNLPGFTIGNNDVEIEKIVILYKNKKFKEYYPSSL